MEGSLEMGVPSTQVCVLFAVLVIVSKTHFFVFYHCAIAIVIVLLAFPTKVFFCTLYQFLDRLWGSSCSFSPWWLG